MGQYLSRLSVFSRALPQAPIAPAASGQVREYSVSVLGRRAQELRDTIARGLTPVTFRDALALSSDPDLFDRRERIVLLRRIAFQVGRDFEGPQLQESHVRLDQTVRAMRDLLPTARDGMLNTLSRLIEEGRESRHPRDH